MLKILEERAAGLIEQIDVAEFPALVSDMRPSDLWTDMGVFS